MVVWSRRTCYFDGNSPNYFVEKTSFPVHWSAMIYESFPELLFLQLNNLFFRESLHQFVTLQLNLLHWNLNCRDWQMVVAWSWRICTKKTSWMRVEGAASVDGVKVCHQLAYQPRHVVFGFARRIRFENCRFAAVDECMQNPKVVGDNRRVAARHQSKVESVNWLPENPCVAHGVLPVKAFLAEHQRLCIANDDENRPISFPVKSHRTLVELDGKLDRRRSTGNWIEVDGAEVTQWTHFIVGCYK